MSIQAMSTHQNLFHYMSFSEARKDCHYTSKLPQKMHFLLSFITNSRKSEKRSNNDNFPEEKWWRCRNVNCRRMNLRSVWTCAYCGTAR